MWLAAFRLTSKGKTLAARTAYDSERNTIINFLELQTKPSLPGAAAKFSLPATSSPSPLHASPAKASLDVTGTLRMDSARTAQTPPPTGDGTLRNKTLSRRGTIDSTASRESAEYSQIVPEDFIAPRVLKKFSSKQVGPHNIGFGEPPSLTCKYCFRKMLYLHGGKIA